VTRCDPGRVAEAPLAAPRRGRASPDEVDATESTPAQAWQARPEIRGCAAHRERSPRMPPAEAVPSRGEACWMAARTSTYRTLLLDPGISGASLVCHPSRADITHPGSRHQQAH
jgi:hypothetical protein